MEGPKHIPNEGILPRERELDHIKTKSGLILKICQNEKVQPRESLLQEMEKSDRVDTDSSVLKELVLKMPDYNLEEKEDFEKAREYIEMLFKTKHDIQKNEGVDELELEMKKKWVPVGIFAYELIGDEAAPKNLLVHVPATDQSPKLGQIRDSLRQIAKFLEQNPTIKNVEGSSLLLAHSLAKKLGFVVKQDGNTNFGLVFTMPREEFIERFL